MRKNQQYSRTRPRTNLPAPLDGRPPPLNPSTIHSLKTGAIWEGNFRRGKLSWKEYDKLIESTREEVVQTLGLAHPERLIITSSVEEARMAALFGLVWASYPERRRIVIVEGDPPGFWEAAHWWARLGWEVISLPLKADGHLDEEEIIRGIDERTVALFLSSSTPEVGVDRWGEVSVALKQAQKVGAEVVVDTSLHHFAYLTLREKVSGKHNQPTRVANPLDLECLTLIMDGSAFSAPLGVGFLYLKPGLKWSPPMAAGTTQNGLRGGLVSPILMRGIQTALVTWNRNRKVIGERLFQLKRKALQLLPAHLPSLKLYDFSDSLPVGVLFGLPGLESEALIKTLEQSGLFLSTGSPCLRTTERGTQVLKALGLLPEEVHSTLHLNLNGVRTGGELQAVIQTIGEVAHQLYYISL